jgi:hypothetical protein
MRAQSVHPQGPWLIPACQDGSVTPSPTRIRPENGGEMHSTRASSTLAHTFGKNHDLRAHLPAHLRRPARIFLASWKHAPCPNHLHPCPSVRSVAPSCRRVPGAPGSWFQTKIPENGRAMHSAQILRTFHIFSQKPSVPMSIFMSIFAYLAPSSENLRSRCYFLDDLPSSLPCARKPGISPIGNIILHPAFCC